MSENFVDLFFCINQMLKKAFFFCLLLERKKKLNK